MLDDFSPEQERLPEREPASSAPPPCAPIKTRGRVRLVCGAVLALILWGAWDSRLNWLPVIGTSLNVSDPLRPAQAVLILPGSDDSRQIVAAGLMQSGYADRVLIPETRGTNRGANPDTGPAGWPTATELTRRILLRQGVPESKIVILDGESHSTMGDAMALDCYFRKVGDFDVIVVTNASHSRRARWAFRHVMPQHQSRLRFYTAPNGYDASRWWISRRGREAVYTEWVKLAFYFTYYGPGWRWCVVLFTIVCTLVVIRRPPTQCHLQGSEHVGVRNPAQSDC